MKGANLNIENNRGFTPISLARHRNYINVVEFLEEENSKKNNFFQLRINNQKQSKKSIFIILHLICLFLGYFIGCEGKEN
jgi:hypothetical protein